jgi:hypothetical protein
MTPRPPAAEPTHPPGLTALLLIVTAVMCLGALFAGLLASRLLELREDLAAARRDCTCCDPNLAPRWP